MSTLPIVDREYVIQRFEGKGGWHYVMIQEDVKAYKGKFGWIQVRGTIDAYDMGTFQLAPYGKGNAMLTLNATIRKAIKKGLGDTIKVVLYAIDTQVSSSPDEIYEVLEFYPKALAFYKSLSSSQQQLYIDYIAEPKTNAAKTERFNTIIDKLESQKEF